MFRDPRDVIISEHRMRTEVYKWADTAELGQTIYQRFEVNVVTRVRARLPTILLRRTHLWLLQMIQPRPCYRLIISPSSSTDIASSGRYCLDRINILYRCRLPDAEPPPTSLTVPICSPADSRQLAICSMDMVHNVLQEHI